MKVMKFGGTSVGDAERIRQLTQIVATEKARDRQMVVVVSAMSGVTNLLLESARRAADGDMATAVKNHAALLERHQAAIARLLSHAEDRARLEAEIGVLLENVSKLCYGVGILGEVPPRALDSIAGAGERLSARIVAAALREANIPAQAFDADALVVTDDAFGEATPDLEATREKSRAALLPAIQDGTTPVVTGFIGATPQGVTTTLGRGGSDYSGGIFGAALDADEVVIWTDADGFMTADPNVAPDAQTIPEISYGEAAELSYYGAKVLHPKTLLPLIPRNIPLFIKNSFRPDAPGTRVSARTGVWRHDIKSVTSIKGVALITVAGRGMMGVTGIAAKTFAAVAAQGSNVLMISQSSSENNLCLIVNAADAERTRAGLHKALEVEFHHCRVERIDVRDRIAIIAAVGEEMHGRPGVAARVFGAVAECGVNVMAIAQGSSELNISFVVDEADAPAAVAAIHRRFELGTRQDSVA
jgi:bifunctional aspartokinase / homoserine dehydrogenase 1